MATKKETAIINLPEINLQTFTLKIVGDSPLICHAWSKKAKEQILNGHLKKATSGREVRRPTVEFADSLYWLTEKPNLDGLTDEEASEILAKVIPQSKFGFPVLAFKSAALDAGFQQGVLARNAGTGTLAKTTAAARSEFTALSSTLKANPLMSLPLSTEHLLRVKIWLESVSVRLISLFVPNLNLGAQN